jgi:hypothetical protein
MLNICLVRLVGSIKLLKARIVVGFVLEELLWWLGVLEEGKLLCLRLQEDKGGVWGWGLV